MMNREYKTYKITSPKGNEVTIQYTPKWIYIPELNHRVDHFEFDNIENSTGYRSKFIFAPLDYEPTDEEIKSFIRSQMEKITGVKYGESYQTTLL